MAITFTEKESKVLKFLQNNPNGDYTMTDIAREFGFPAASSRSIVLSLKRKNAVKLINCCGEVNFVKLTLLGQDAKID